MHASYSGLPRCIAMMSSVGLYCLDLHLCALVCSFLPPRDVLLSVRRTSSRTAQMLSPACFAACRPVLSKARHHDNEDQARVGFFVAYRQLQRLADERFPLSALSQELLAQAFLVLSTGGDESLPWQLFAQALAKFGSLGAVEACGWDARVPHLVALLSSVLHSRPLQVAHTISVGGWSVPYEPASRLVLDVTPFRFPRLRRFNCFQQELTYNGGAAFLSAHPALRCLGLVSSFIDEQALLQLLESPTSLQQLEELTMHDFHQGDARLLQALAVSPLRDSGAPRMIRSLTLCISCSTAAVRETLRLPHLRSLTLSCDSSDWPNAFSCLLQQQVSEGGGVDVTTAWPALEEFVHSENREQLRVSSLPYRQQWQQPAVPPRQENWHACWAELARSPLRRLQLCIPEPMVVDQPVVDALARMTGLRSLTLTSMMWQQADWIPIDWSTAASMQPAIYHEHFPHLLHLSLQAAHRLCTAGLVTLLRACPRLQTLELKQVEFDVDYSVACVLVGLCADIRTIRFTPRLSQSERVPCSHSWPAAKGADLRVVAEAYGVRLPAFSRLSTLELPMCKCVSPAVWHALLSFFCTSPQLHVIQYVTAPHPLTALALQYLPGLACFCWSWGLPYSFESMLHNPGSKTTRYASVSHHPPHRRHDWYLTVLEQYPRGMRNMEQYSCRFVGAESSEGVPAPAAAVADGRARFFRDAALTLPAEQMRLLQAWQRGDFSEELPWPPLPTEDGAALRW